MKKKLLRFLVYWCIPGLLLLPIGGCFTAMSRFMGSSPGPVAVVVARTLDVVTMPVQIVAFATLGTVEHFRDNTGERGRRKREYEHYQAEVKRYEEMLDKDFSQVFKVGEYLSVTGTPARTALHKWLCAYGIHHPEREEIDSLVERLLSMPDIAFDLMHVLYQQNLSEDLRKKLCVSMVGFSRTQDARVDSKIVYYADKFLSDDEIKGLISKADDETDKALSGILLEREKRREKLRQEETESKARQHQEAAERRKRAMEDGRARVRRMVELHAEVGNWMAMTKYREYPIACQIGNML